MTGEPLRLAVAAMGTRFELALLAGRGNLRAAGEAAVEEIESWHRRLTRFAPDSLLSHITREACHAPVSLDRDTYELLDDAMRVWRSSAGAFDITVAPFMTEPGCADSAVPAGSARTGADAIHLDPERWTVAFTAPHVSLDLGGIGKGHALDCAARVLRDAGVTCALLHGGTSSIVAIAAPEGSAWWRVAVGTGADARVIGLRDGAMSVSDVPGECDPRSRSRHIVDPARGGSVAQPRRAIVTGPSARLADAWSTALVVLGRVPEGFPSDFSGWITEHQTALT